LRNTVFRDEARYAARICAYDIDTLTRVVRAARWREGQVRAAARA
jgi:hypothetical protein